MSWVFPWIFYKYLQESEKDVYQRWTFYLKFQLTDLRTVFCDYLSFAEFLLYDPIFKKFRLLFYLFLYNKHQYTRYNSALLMYFIFPKNILMFVGIFICTYTYMCIYITDNKDFKAP